MKMKQVLLELVLIVAIFAVKANATTYPYFLGQFNNIQTTSCSDSRVSRGYALVATATYPDGASHRCNFNSHSWKLIRRVVLRY
jgi:hypothetical protein